MDNRRKRTFSEIMDNLVEALHEAATENEETLNDELRRSGYDPDALLQRGKTFIQNLKGRVRLAKAQQRRERLLDFVAQVKTAFSSMSDPKHQISTWLKKEFGRDISNQALQAFYHKLDTIETEDMESLAQDAELLQLWENLEHEGGEGEKAS